LPLPPIPAKPLKVDKVTRGDHHYIRAGDECFYLWEYEAGQKPPYGPANQFIRNLKIRPSDITRDPRRALYNTGAIAHGANALRRLLSQHEVETRCTIVPIPCSKTADHGDYDDRLNKMLQQGFSGLRFDMQPLLQTRQSTAADHESGGQRATYAELLANTVLLPCSTPARPTIVVLDDVLTSGKHFRVASDLLTSAFPNARVVGLFLARRYFSAENLGFSAIDDA
jgi:hypothetical protein